MTPCRYSSFSPEIIVLKFGSSILESLSSFNQVAVEIKRFVAQGYRVVAIVSAIGNTTDALEESQQKLNLHNTQLCAKARALLLSTGELQSVAYLTQTLLAQKIPCHFITNPIYAEGDYINATPQELNHAAFEKAFKSDQVVVAPGFIAQNAEHEPCLLGRGGSDLSALFIAHELNAKHCILLKDVDGVYNLDPNKHENAIRYDSLTYECAKEKATQVIQPQAIAWAKSHCLSFEIGKLNGNHYTTIGALDTVESTRNTTDQKIEEVA